MFKFIVFYFLIQTHLNSKITRTQIITCYKPKIDIYVRQPSSKKYLYILNLNRSHSSVEKKITSMLHKRSTLFFYWMQIKNYSQSQTVLKSSKFANLLCIFWNVEILTFQCPAIPFFFGYLMLKQTVFRQFTTSKQLTIKC